MVRRYPSFIALLAGALAACGFEPLGAWPVTLAGFAVLIALVAEAPGMRAAAARGWAFGVGHFSVGLNWIAYAFNFQDAMPHWFGYLAVVLLSLYLAAYPALAAILAWRGRAHPRRFVLAFAAAWIATEYLRATMFTGFAWNALGVAALGTPLAVTATLIGTYGVSGLVVLIAGALWLASRRDWRPALLIAAPVAALMAVLALPQPVPGVRTIGPAVRIVQPNLSLAEQRDRDADEVNVRRLETLTGPSTAAPRLILWPEGALPYFVEEESWARLRLAEGLGPRDVLLAGGSALVYGRDGKLAAARNSVFALDARGHIVARYDKAHLVPYGEYLPARPLLSAIGLSKLVQSDVDFIPGAGPATLTLTPFGKIGVQLCYEIIFSGEVVDRHDRPDLIFNPSIDAWFGAWGPPQHLAQARMRAIEEALPVVRATSTGISAVIDGRGHVLAALPLDTGGFIATRLPPALAPTAFARMGNIVPLGFALLLALLAVALRFRAR